MKRLLIIPLALLWAEVAVAASPIVDAQYVADAIARNALVWDVRPADVYARGHIAGAISIGDAAKVLRDDNTEDFIAIDRIEKILGTAGLDLKREVIVYGNRGTWNPYFGLYTVQYFGGSNVRVYHEGIEDWTAAGRAISSEASPLSVAADSRPYMRERLRSSVTSPIISPACRETMVAPMIRSVSAGT